MKLKHCRVIKKKVNKSALKKKADILFSSHVRSYGRCELYGIGGVKCSDTLQTMHIVSRSNLRLRWDDNNVLCGCSGHHMYYTVHPYEFIKMIEECFPSKDEYIKKHKNELVKATPEFYLELIKKYGTKI
jgi:hypothetical protein